MVFFHYSKTQRNAYEDYKKADELSKWLTFRTSVILGTFDRDFVLKRGQRFFSRLIKKYEKQKPYRKMKVCFSCRQFIGITGMGLCKYNFSVPPATNELEKNSKK